MASSLGLWFAQHTFSGMREEFYMDLAEALDDGAALVDRIEELAERARKEGDLIAPLFRLWLRRLDDRNFPQALVGTVPDSDVMILEAAEGSGKLSEGLVFLSQAIQASDKMVKAVRKAIVRGGMLSLSVIAFVVFFAVYGIPTIEQIVPPDMWPWIGQCLRSASRFIVDYGVFLGVSLTGLLIFYVWSLRNWFGPTRLLFDKYFMPYTVYRDYSGALFLVSISTLMSNGLGLNDALNQLKVRASPWLRGHIRKIQVRLDYDSHAPGEAFATGIFGRRLTHRIIDFGKRSNGSFPSALEKVGLKSVGKVTEGVLETAERLNTFLKLLNGAAIAFVIAGSLSTVYESQSGIDRQLSNTQKIVK